MTLPGSGEHAASDAVSDGNKIKHPQSGKENKTQQRQHPGMSPASLSSSPPGCIMQPLSSSSSQMPGSHLRLLPLFSPPTLFPPLIVKWNLV